MVIGFAARRNAQRVIFPRREEVKRADWVCAFREIQAARRIGIEPALQHRSVIVLNEVDQVFAVRRGQRIRDCRAEGDRVPTHARHDGNQILRGRNAVRDANALPHAPGVLTVGVIAQRVNRTDRIIWRAVEGFPRRAGDRRRRRARHKVRRDLIEPRVSRSVQVGDRVVHARRSALCRQVGRAQARIVGRFEKLPREIELGARRRQIYTQIAGGQRTRAARRIQHATAQRQPRTNRNLLRRAAAACAAPKQARVRHGGQLRQAQQVASADLP